MNTKINIATIAKMAKTSTASVSNYINCTETIPLSVDKRLKIMEAMRQMNYRPSGASSQLRRNSNLPSKAVFIFGSYPACNPSITYRNPMLCELLAILASQFKSELGLNLEIRAIDNEGSIISWNETIADADAIICYGRLDEKLLELSVRRNIPLVIISETDSIAINSQAEPALSQDIVYWNAGKHLETMLDYINNKGAKDISFISSSNIKANHPESFAVEAEAKIAEFRKYVSSHTGISGELLSPPSPDVIIHIDYESRNTYEFLKDIDLSRFDAIVAHNDAVAQGAAWALQKQNIQVGKDIMLVGEGDYLSCRYAIPSITTISYDKKFMAEEVCRIFKKKLQENRPCAERILIPSMLIERESTKFSVSH